MSNTQKRNTFFGGAAILALSSAVVKLIGGCFKIPLAALLPNEAYADFNSAYNIYNFFLTISTAGLPVALSKSISEAHALGRENQVRRIFRVAFGAFLTMGLISFFCMSVLAAPVSQMAVSNPKAVWCVMALSPSVLCVCVISSFRGYFQGQFNMGPTGISQVIEALLKLVVGLSLVVLIQRMALQPPEFGSSMMAVGAIIGVSTGSVVALAYLIVIYLRHRRERVTGTDRTDSSGRIFANLMKIAVPVTLGSASNAIVMLIDNKLVMSQLRTVFETVNGMAAAPALDAARGLYGIYGKAMSFYNLPFSMMIPLTACIIPAVSACRAKRDALGAQHITESAMRVGVLVALPMCFGLIALGSPIMGLILSPADTLIGGPLLSVLGIAAIFVSVQLLCNSILQANGMVNLPVLVVVIGGIVKIVVNYILVGNPDILINGAPIGTLCCFAIVSFIELFIIRRCVPAPPRFGKVFLKPLIASAIMGAGAWATYGLAHRLLFGMSAFRRVTEAGAVVFSTLGKILALGGAIGVGVVLYLVLVLALRVISKEDLELMPKGDKIAKILHIH
ncbi:MAG: polysaccharide biosynthesis protein [Pseudoflavonifractor sp.]